jgi:hypothetical protein
MLTDAAKRVASAMENPKYRWRTIEGLANDTGISSDQIDHLINGELADQVLTTRDKLGRTLYTTRRHYNRSQPLVNRLLTVLSDQIR